MRKPHRQNVISAILIVIFIFITIGFAAALAVVFAPVKMTMEEDAYTLSFLFYSESADYADVEVALLDESYHEDAKRVHNYGGISKELGTYKNDAYGEHVRMTYSENVHNFILLKRSDGSVTVFNLKTQEKTEALYAELVEKLG